MPPKYQFNIEKIISDCNVDQSQFNELKNWCKNQKLPTLSDEQLIQFLVRSNKSVQSAQKLIWGYFECKSRAPDLFLNQDIDGEDMKEALTVYDVAVMPEVTNNGEIIVFGRLLDNNYKNFHLNQLLKLAFIISEFCLYSNALDGLIVIIDMKGIGFLHLTKVKIGLLQHFFRFIQEGLPCRIKQIHVLNTVNFIDKILLIVKPFLKKDLYEIIKFHPNSDINFLPEKLLPEDYGGNLPRHHDLALKTYEKIIHLKTYYEEVKEQIESFNLFKK